MIFKKKNLRWVVWTLVAIAVVPMVITTYEVIFSESKSVVFLENYHPQVTIFVISYYVLLLCVAVYWFVRQIVFISSLKNEKTKTELMVLQSQVTPHFFFNMLNNLYGLVERDAQKAKELILKLSDMMRYSIYEGQKDKVILQSEIDFLKNYIELHKMRYHKHIVVDFNCDADGNQKIIPLLMIILLENAFKHGIESLRENAYIEASLTTSRGKIIFSIENNYEKNGIASGIGLKNLKRRLELNYPNQHELSFSITENVYKVQLILHQL